MYRTVQHAGRRSLPLRASKSGYNKKISVALWLVALRTKSGRWLSAEDWGPCAGVHGCGRVAACAFPSVLSTIASQMTALFVAADKAAPASVAQLHSAVIARS